MAAFPENPSAGEQAEAAPGDAAGAAKLLGFALRAREVVIGRNGLPRARRKLLFLLVTADISENSREELRHDYPELPLLTAFDSAFLEHEFKLGNCKVLGLKKTALGHGILEKLRTPQNPDKGKLEQE